MNRRQCLGLLTGLLAAGHVTAQGAPARRIRIGLTPVFLDDQIGFLRDWQRFLEAELDQSVEFVQRGSYREIVDLALQNTTQFSWLCGYPYVRNRDRLRLLATPVWGGAPLYQSYLIVPVGDTQTTDLFGLRDKVFAYSDPDSNSGFLYPQFQLITSGSRPEAFFRKTFFTYSHRNVVEAVGARLAQGGAVDGYVWETLARNHPDLVARTRVVSRSVPFGFPPFIASPAVPTRLFERMQRTLLAMHTQGLGVPLLRQLNLDRFEAGQARLYDRIAQMAETVNRGRS